ncbi:hypothetical protein V8E36_000169 [Tilletia maclaganii]
MRSILSTSVALLALGSTMVTAHPHSADAAHARRSPATYGAKADNDGADLKHAKAVANVANDFESRSATHIKQISDNDLKGLKIVGNVLDGFEKREPCRKTTTLVSDNDLVDAKNVKVVGNILNDFEKRSATHVKQIADDDLVDAKGLKLIANVADDFERRSATHIKQVADNDLVDAKKVKVVVNALNDFERREPYHKITQIADNDLVDAKGLKLIANIANDFEKRSATHIKQVAENDLVDAKKVKVAVNALNDFERRSDNVSEDLEARSAAEEDSPLERRGIFSYSDDDIIDLKNLGINLDLLSGKSHYCLSLPHHFEWSGSNGRKWRPHSRPSKRPGQYNARPKKNKGWKGHNYHRSCPANYKHGDAYYSDNDLLDIKGLTLNVCLLSDTGACDTTSYTDNIASWKCTSRHGCCVRRHRHHHGGKKTTTTIVQDNDGVDLKGTKIGVNVLNGKDGLLGGGNDKTATGLLGGSSGLLGGAGTGGLLGGGAGAGGLLGGL